MRSIGKCLRDSEQARRPGVSSMMSSKRSFNFLCAPKEPKASGMGKSGSGMERTWLAPMSQWSANSSMPQTVMPKGGVASIMEHLFVPLQPLPCIETTKAARTYHAKPLRGACTGSPAPNT